MRFLPAVFRPYKFLMVVGLLSLAACTTTETAAPDPALVAKVAKDAYQLGYVVGYNELCAQFRGTGADDKIVQEFKRKFSRGTAFEQGYDQLSHYGIYDSLSGLNQCQEMRALLESVHKTYVEGLGTKA
ncbi:MAG: hypothetical protein V7723_04590 [Sneathiella sp.]|uniref:hypothetical protein n=1 Tax=Sneathiella sp. TaxID=1964365 RepID=UPI0030012632